MSFEDKWEGEIPAQLSKRLNNFSPEMRAQIQASFKLVADQARVNCWHSNDMESVAIWSLYTSGLEGLQFRQQLENLKRQFPQTNEE